MPRSEKVAGLLSLFCRTSSPRQFCVEDGRLRIVESRPRLVLCLYSQKAVERHKRSLAGREAPASSAVFTFHEKLAAMASVRIVHSWERRIPSLCTCSSGNV